MKTYKVKIAWEGVKVGDILNPVGHFDDKCLTDFDLAIALHLGFIEEVGAVKKKFVPKVGEMMFHVCSNGNVEGNRYESFGWQQQLVHIGNSYRTEAEALEAKERVLKAY